MTFEKSQKPAPRIFPANWRWQSPTQVKHLELALESDVKQLLNGNNVEILRKVLDIAGDSALRLGGWETYRHYRRRTAALMLQVGVRSGRAIRLLLAEQFPHDAAARARALYELACSAAVVAGAQPHQDEALAIRYLAHAGLIPSGLTPCPSLSRASRGSI